MRKFTCTWLSLNVFLYRWRTWQRKNLCIYFVGKVPDSPGEVQNTGELHCTNVEDGKPEWDSFLARSEIKPCWNYIFICSFSYPTFQTILSAFSNFISKESWWAVNKSLHFVSFIACLQVHLSWAIWQWDRSCKVLIIINSYFLALYVKKGFILWHSIFLI